MSSPKINYAAQESPVAATKHEIRVDYNANGKSGAVSSAPFDVEVKPKDGAFIRTDVTASKSPKGLSGTGTLSSPYKFTALSNNILELKYTFTNEGNKEANKFKVTGLPFEAEIFKDDCGVTDLKTSPTINAGGYCAIELKIPTSSFLDQQASFESEALLMASVELPLRYSYTDLVGSKLSEQEFTNIKRYIDFNRKWAKFEPIAPEVKLIPDSTNGDYWLATYKTIVKVDPNMVTAGLVTYPLTITPHWQHKPNAVEFTSCTINSQEIKSCEATARFPLKDIGENSLKLEMELAGTGMSQNDKLYAPVVTNLVKNNVSVSITENLKLPETKGLVEYGQYKDKIIYDSGESYPFKVQLKSSEPIEGDIKLDKVNLKSGIFNAVVNSVSCNADRTNCDVFAYISMTEGEVKPDTKCINLDLI